MSRSRRGEWLLNGATIILTVCAVVVAGLRVHDELASRAAPDGASGRTRRISDWRAYSSGGTRIGRVDAPVTIVEFVDYQCPFCRIASGSIHDLQRWYTKDLAIVYRQLPLPFHKFAFPAAIAAECAARSGKFAELHDQLFAQADSLGAKSWMSFALDAGIADTSRFAACLKDDAAVRLIRRDSLAASRLQIAATPTFLINDLLVSGNAGFAQLNEYIKAALAESRH